MQVIYEETISQNLADEKPLWLALGNFDGVHLAHQVILEDAVENSIKNNCTSAVLLLEPHPEIEFLERQNFLLTTLEEKIGKISALDVEYAIVKPFTWAFAQMLPAEFAGWLKQKLGVGGLSVGFDYSFGYKGMGSAVDLKSLGAQYGFPVSIIDPIIWEEQVTVSSEFCRKLIREGQIEKANQILKAPYQLTGEIIKGEGRGSKIGFPTANMAFPPEKVVPKRGVYLVKIHIDHHAYWGICNIGCKPTFQGDQILAETYILDAPFMNIYQQTITLTLHRFLRTEQKFSNTSQLKRQITLDIEKAKEALALLKQC